MALVSSAWVFEENKNCYCYWPTYLKSTSKREKAVKNHEELDTEKCQICAVNIKYSTAKYDSALYKLKIYEEEENSQIESEIENNKSRRVCKSYIRNRKSEYEYSSGSSEDDLLPPKIPQPEKFVYVQDIPFSDSAGSQKEKGFNNMNKKQELTTEKNCQLKVINNHKYLNQPIKAQLKSNINTDSSNTSFISSISASNSCSNCYTCKSNEALLKELMKSMEKISQDLKHLIQINQVKENENLIDVDDIHCSNTFDDLKELNVLLENEEQFKTLCMKLSLVGGKDVATCTRKILSRLISHQLTLNLNWTGRNEKSGLKELGNVVKVIVASVRRNPNSKNGTADEIEHVIKTWLRNAADRDGGRVRRNKNTN
ncbi:uncharacterized protein LOC115890328 [Sitophilus oryzae]|uniref:Uncharacterized protein LOC115890328 n=1 Tax=Sitophilus oryzae TaxID=7048 RepID=A0A6J2YQQ4_SITOR|nr:uncharacterized protein LOC115890328 [Sitophilus oryzae]XP_030766379.1 uncharacterized protein LOC115890328 [Sitophilus oryzae]XP_030766380.1 uncharacterized protein LOC115890328 [Sitophilus oryzae]